MGHVTEKDKGTVRIFRVSSKDIGNPIVSENFIFKVVETGSHPFAIVVEI